MTKTRMGLALWESAISLSTLDRWATLAWIDTSLRYRRTVLGPWWVTLSTGAMIGSVGLAWATIFNADLSIYMPFFATGVILWTLISGSLTEACNVFTQAGGLIKSVPTPPLVHVYRMLARHFIILGHNAVLMVILWLIFQWSIGWSASLTALGLAINMVALVGATLILAILCTRFRDVAQIVTAILQLVFLLTPIMWTPESVHGKAVSILIDINPFYYLLEVFRGPLLGNPPALDVWLIASGCALASVLVGHMLYARFQHRITYWL